MSRYENWGGVLTDPRYWDCECDTDYIHSRDFLCCEFCGAHQSEQPNSRVNEVKDLIKELGSEPYQGAIL